MNLSHEEQKKRARMEAEHHEQNSNVTGVRSNADLSDEELERRNNGLEPHTSIIDQVTAGYALNNRKKAREGK